VNDAGIVEAILFASDAPLSPGEIARADEALDEDRVEAAMAVLKAAYDDSGRAFELREVADGVQLMTRPEFAPYLERFDTVPKSSRLSGPALEALAIVAYRQPISRMEIEYIRGVNSTGVIRTLLDRELIRAVGRGEGVGRPVLYGTSGRFMEHFGFPSMEHLPRPEELPVVLRERAPPEERAEEDERLEDGSGEVAEEPMSPDEAVAAVLAHAGSDEESDGEGGGSEG
jgi:segregation and condensation protein B